MKILTGFIFAGCFIVAGCNRNEEILSGQYYEFPMKDSAAAVISGDPIHILIIQLPVTTAYIAPLTVKVSDNAGLLDTIRLRMDVTYGSYASAAWNPTKVIRARQDSVILWYAGATWYAGNAARIGMQSVAGDPIPESYLITGVEIIKAPGRSVTVASTLIR